jgi:hypothetical protein
MAIRNKSKYRSLGNRNLTAFLYDVPTVPTTIGVYVDCPITKDLFCMWKAGNDFGRPPELETHV